VPFLLDRPGTRQSGSPQPGPDRGHVRVQRAAGTVTYRYEFDDRPAPYTPGAVSEVVTVTNHGAADVFAQVPVLGRPYGPVLQSLGRSPPRSGPWPSKS
jgi:hypothetical protein